MGRLKSKTTDSSTSIQVGGNINIGVSFTEISDLIQRLYELNFPKLVEEASQKAQENVIIFVKKFLEDMKEDNSSIQKKLTDPNCQYLLNSSIQTAARFGDKVDLSLLAKALRNAILVNSDENDLPSVLSLALNIIPQLRKPELLAILVSSLIHSLEFRFDNADLVNISFELCLKNYKDMGDVSENQMFHMVSLGLYAYNPLFSDKCIDLLARRYNKIPNFKERINSMNYKAISFLINYYDHNKLVRFHPLPVANVIGFLLLKENLPELDIKVLFDGR